MCGGQGKAAGIETATPDLARGVDGLRIAIAGDYFERGGLPEAHAAVETIARTLEVTQRAVLPEAARTRAAAFVIGTSEGGAPHVPRLRSRAADFDPATRDRFLSGALVPAECRSEIGPHRDLHAAQGPRHRARVLRFGLAESLYGHAAIASFRAARSTVDLARDLFNTVITTFGRDLATANIEYRRKASGRVGRQSQTWARMPQGWRIVAAHVSFPAG